jgi:ABC-type nitrate/sulfonate/bicarbonate transport system permease component
MSNAQEAWRTLGLGALGIALFLLAWELIGLNRLAGLSWPAFSTVIDYALQPPRYPMFGRAMGATFTTVAVGYVSGAVLGIVLAGAVHVVTWFRPGVDRLASVIHSIPPIALAPLLIVLINRDSTGIVIAALNVFFILYVATGSGLNASSRSHRDLFQVLGARPSTRLMRLDFPAALPAMVGGLKYAVPAAFIGAILGEWFGSSRGLGLLMVSAMQNFQIPLLWSAVLIASTSSLLLFGLMSLLEQSVRRRNR